MAKFTVVIGNIVYRNKEELTRDEQDRASLIMYDSPERAGFAYRFYVQKDRLEEANKFLTQIDAEVRVARHLRENRKVQVNDIPRYSTIMARTNEIIGYRVRNTSNNAFLHFAEGPICNNHYFDTLEPEPIARGNAYRRLAGYLDQFPDVDADVLTVEPVYRETTPVENASAELGTLLSSLCKRHGLDLGLTQDQINKQIGKELEALKAGGSPSLGFLVGGIPHPLK